VSEVWQTMKERKLKLTAIKLSTILYWLLLQKTSTVCRKNELFIFEKKQSTKNHIKEEKSAKCN